MIATLGTYSEVEVKRLIDRNTALEQQLLYANQQLQLLRQQLFGRKCETKLSLPDEQLAFLFDEPELVAEPDLPEPILEEVTYKRKKAKGKREQDLSQFPTVQVVHELPAGEQVCPDCSGAMHECGTSVHRRELTVTPAVYVVTEHLQTAYSCRPCDEKSHRTPVLKSKVPAPVIHGSGVASPSLLAHIVNQKYVLALPLHRQQQEFARHGVDISRQTMANWMIRVGGSYLTPIFMLMKSLLLSSEVIHADETTVQVLKEEGKPAESMSYMWMYRTSGDTNLPIVLYEYQPNRKHENPKNFLAGFRGYVHCDGYEAYHNLDPAIIPVGCWAHVRRKFTDLIKAIPETMRNDSIPNQALQYCDALFAIERELKNLDPIARHEARLIRSKPLMDEFFTFAQRQHGTGLATPRSATGRALAYAIGQRKYLLNVLLDGRLELSNNQAERSIKPFVIGRKNWMFANTPRGATASAVIYSIIETAKENGLNPYKYLEYIFETAPNLNMSDSDEARRLLPWNAPAHCFQKPRAATDANSTNT
jgi:transposase